MQIRRDLALGPGIIAAVALALAFITIGLFSRMTPAIRAILDENVASQEAAYEIVELVARRTVSELTDGERDLLRDALERARHNVTIPGETPIIAAMDAAVERVLAGDDGGVLPLLDAAQALTRLNLRAMQEADDEAAALGTAGAWAAVFGGVALLLLSIVVVVRLRRRVVVPVAELAAVLEAASRGRLQRRCRRIEGVAELERALAAANAVLDQLSARTAAPPGRTDDEVQAVLVAALELLDHAVAVLRPDGSLLAANAAALELLATDPGDEARRAIAAALRDGAAVDVEGVVASPIPGRDSVICRFEAPPSPT